LVLNTNLENSARPWLQHYFADVILKGREKFLCGPAGSQEPAALGTVFDFYAGML